MPDSSGTKADETFGRFLTLFRYLRQQARHINTQGINPRQFAVLRFLLEAGSATVGEVQAHIYLSASATSVLIAKLEGKGVVTRTRSKEDNRVVIVELTPAGRELAENTPLVGLPLLRRRLRTVSPERLALIDEALIEIMTLMEVTDIE